jgi:cytochrome c oxidase subunit 1
MHLAGLGGNPRHYAQMTGIRNAATQLLAPLIPIQTAITHAAFVLAAAQFLFLINLAWSFRRGRVAPENPWSATTLEWAASDIDVTVQRGPCHYFQTNSGPSFETQWSLEAKPE